MFEASIPFPKNAPDPEHFEKAVELGRVLVTNDQPFVDTAHQWLEKGRRFKGMVTWPRAHYKRMTIGDLVRKFDELAAQDQPFDPDYPIVRIKPDYCIDADPVRASSRSGVVGRTGNSRPERQETDSGILSKR